MLIAKRMEGYAVNKMKSLLYVLAVGLVLSGCISIPTGDGGKIKLSKDGVEIEGEDGKKAKIEVDAEEGGSTITMDDGSTVQMGSHAEVPEDFPSEILVPAKEKLINVTELTDDEKRGYMLIYQLDDSMKDNVIKYKDDLEENAYEVNEIEIGETVSLQGSKGESFLMYQFMGEDGDYSLSVHYSMKKK